MSISEQKEFFNNKAERWIASPSPRTEDLEKAGLQLRLLNIKSGASVLDVGTGTGILIPPLTKFTDGANITAIDFAEKMIAIARGRFQDLNITFIEDDVMTHQFAKESFDFVICYSVFPHFEDPRAAFLRMAGMLKQNGQIAIMHSAGRDAIARMHGHINAVKFDAIPQPDIRTEIENHDRRARYVYVRGS